MEFLAIAIVILIIIILQTYLYKNFGFKNFEYQCYFSTSEAVEGDEIELVEIMTNKKILPLPWIKSEITTSKYLEFANAQSQITDQTRFVPSFFMLKSFSSVRRTWKVKCTKRGVFTIDNVSIVSSDLFGNYSLSKGFPINITLTVLPRPLEQEELKVSSKYFYGDIVVKRFILPDLFYRAGVREYQNGDTMNQIHWGATARQQTLMSYNNEYTSSQNVTVVLNMQSSEFERADVTNREAMENAIRICATVLDNTQKQGMPIRFISNSNSSGGRENTEIAESFGSDHIHNLLYILSTLKLMATRDFVTYLDDFEKSITTTDVIVITCYVNEVMLEFARHKESENVHVKFICVKYLPEDILNSGMDIVCVADSFALEGNVL